MKKVLLTGFEPFGCDKINPSQIAVQTVGEMVKENTIIKGYLPVEWHVSQKILFDLIDREKPDKVILVGLSAGSDCIRIERVGVNICGSILDNKGLYSNDDNICREEKIFENGNDGYFSTFNYDEIFHKLNEENIKTKMSFSAGTYMCNYVLYSSLYKAKKENLNIPIGFIHVPLLPMQREEDVPCMELSQIVKALEITIENA